MSVAVTESTESSACLDSTSTGDTAKTTSHEEGPFKAPIIDDENTPLLGAPAGCNGTMTQNKDDKTESNFSFSTLSTRSKTILFLCAMSNFFVCLSFSILAPFFPKEAEKKGLSTTTIGLIFSVFELVIFLSSPIFGIFLTRLGTRFVLVAGICVGGSCSILFGLLDKCPSGMTFAAMCFACRSLEALALAAFITASFAVLSNEFPKNVATVLGMTETASGIGMMVGPGVGGGLYELGGYGLPFFVMGALIIIAGVVLAVLLPEVENASTIRKGSLLTLMASPMTLISLMSVVLCSVGISFLDPLLAKHLDPFNLSTAVVGLIFVVAPALYAFCSPIWGYLVDNTGLIGSMIVPGHLLYAVAFFLIGPSPWMPFLPFTLWMMVVAICFFGISIGCVAVPNIKCLVMGALEVGFEDNLDTYAIVSGLFNSMFSFGGFIGPTLGGVMVGQMGFDLSASVVGVVNIAACLVALVFFTRRHFRIKNQQTKSPSHNGKQENGGQINVMVTEDVQGQNNYHV